MTMLHINTQRDHTHGRFGRAVAGDLLDVFHTERHADAFPRAKNVDGEGNIFAGGFLEE
jgi:hypothetical protein